MGWLMVVAVFGAFFLVVVLPAALITVARSRTRNHRLAAFASSMGFSYCRALPGDVHPLVVSGNRVYQSAAAESFLRQFGGCPFFDCGSYRGVANVIHGRRWNRDWLIFDYHHWTESRHSGSEPQHATCVAARTGQNLGRLSIEPRLPLLGPLMALVEPYDLVELGDPEFDAKFLVRSADPRDAPALLQPPVRQYLLSLWHSPAGWYRVAYVQDNTLVIVESSFASVKHIGKMMEIARCFLDAVAAQG